MNESENLNEKISTLEKELQELRKKRNSLEQETMDAKIEGYIGRCFQTETHDNNMNRQYYKIVARGSELMKNSLWLFWIIVPKSKDEEESFIFEDIKLGLIDYEKMEYDNEISEKVFKKMLDAKLKFLKDAGMDINIDLCIKNDIRFEISK